MKSLELKLKHALSCLRQAEKSLTSAKKRKTKKRKNPCQAKKANPRVHFPKTRRGRPEKTRTWVITRKGKTPLRFRATKKGAFNKSKGLASRGKRLVLDGPK